MDRPPQTAPAEWKPLIVCPHAEMSSRIRLACSELGMGGVSALAEYPRMGTIAGMAAQQGSNICFLDVASNLEHALLLISELSPAVPVVVLNPRNDAELILKCLRQGASEFLANPTAEQVAAALDHIRRARAPAPPPRQALVCCVAPGKAGAGASTVAVHLAIAMKRQCSGGVLLVDTDVVAGSIAFLLKLKPELHLGDVVRDRRRLDADLWARMPLRAHGVDVLPAPESPATRIEMHRQAAHELLSFWREHYDAIVLDTAGTRAQSLDLLQLSDEVLLVASGEVAALYTARRAIEYLEQNGLDSAHIRLVINRYASGSSLSKAEVTAALKLEPYAVLEDEAAAVSEAMLLGRPVAPGSRLGRSVDALAARLLGKEKPIEKRKSLLSLMSRSK